MQCFCCLSAVNCPISALACVKFQISSSLLTFVLRAGLRVQKEHSRTHRQSAWFEHEDAGSPQLFSKSHFCSGMGLGLLGNQLKPSFWHLFLKKSLFCTCFIFFMFSCVFFLHCWCFLVICELALVVMLFLACCVISVLVLHVVCVYFDIANVNNGGSH